MFKRFFDFTFAFLGLVFTVPFLLILVGLIKIETPGPGIFNQKRLGKNKKPFILRKLRTMAIETEHALSHETSKNSVTKMGEFLRRTKIDELPQLWNILCGEMSFVGPRPGLLFDKKLIAERDALNIYSMLPGITGIAQTKGIDMSDPEKLAKADATYLREQSLMLDIKLIFKTLRGAGSGDRVKSG